MHRHWVAAALVLPPLLLPALAWAAQEPELIGPVRYAPQPVPTALSAAASGVVPVGKGQIRYWDSGGAGPAVVLLHPYTGNADSWPYQQAALAAAGYRVIAYSRRGHAGSSPVEPPQVDTDDLLALLDHLQVARCHLVGVAGGGIVATDFALTHPQRVRSLVIAASIVAIADPDFMRASAALRLPGFAELPPEMQELGPQYRAVDPEGVARWRAVLQANGHPAVARTLETARPVMRSRLTVQALSAFAQPVLMVSGDADLYAPPALMNRLAQSFPKAQAKVIAGSGHAPHWERPDVFNRLLLEFWRTQGD